MRNAMRLALVASLLVCGAAFGKAKPKVVTIKITTDSETGGYEGWRAMDGNPKTMWHTQWKPTEPKHPHEITVDLGKSYEVKGFAYLPREGGAHGTIGKYAFHVGPALSDLGGPIASGTFAKKAEENVIEFPQPVKGRYVRLRAFSEVAGRKTTSAAELRILVDGVQFLAAKRAAPAPKKAPAPRKAPAPKTPATELGRQYQTLHRDVQKRAHFTKVAPQTFRSDALILDTDRDPADVVLRRTAALMADLKDKPNAPDLGGMTKELADLQAAAKQVDVKDFDARYALYEKACGLRRRVAFANPLLDFDQLLFIKRPRSNFNHMCDQFYAVNMQPGGGLFVLSDPFGEVPKVRDVLADSVVERGRLKGSKLEGGSFVSPDLSYDGKTILFAYAECKGDTKHRHHTDPSKGHWHEQRCYHIFKVNVDGSGLEQLTDGTWNDFDPCWLPNGRIVFISERRGGYLRCGRTCPTYTLYDMKPDGSDILCVSPHETNEWQPSVSNDGMIVYTRWDYVDRHGRVAHLSWVTTPDGRDARAVHGNFAPRELRQDMEMDIRSIPNSPKLVATGAPHHGQAFGPLVVIDPRVEDDDAMAPTKRLTPEINFPETQGGGQVYGTAWPLSEDYYLCVYDDSMTPGAGRQGKKATRGDYGVYLLDSFGNKELIYRDPKIASLSPMPLRPRPAPPVVPGASQRLATVKPDEATLGVVNVYDSLKAWPDGTKIKSLRVYQIVPMSVPSGGPPHEVGLRLPGIEGSDSVILARRVLGTVPVEKDGSAHFTVPAMRELYFQALDEKGLAVQSMRSAAYLQPGEKLICQGCHEPKHRAPKSPPTTPLALGRTPSTIQPDVDGSNPFSYPRLVQPVLEKHCLPCHTKNPKKAPDLTRTVVAKGRNKWYASYHSLAPKYGFWSYGDRFRTTPGKFGARASKLYQMLAKGHNDLKLPPEDLHRITLWLDSTSVFYGVYEKEGGEAQLRGEIVQPTLD